MNLRTYATIATAVAASYVFSCGRSTSEDFSPTAPQEPTQPSQGYPLPYSTGTSLDEKRAALKTLTDAIDDTLANPFMVLISGPRKPDGSYGVIGDSRRGEGEFRHIEIFDPELNLEFREGSLVLTID